MCEELRRTFRKRIAASTWLSEGSKAAAIAKLDNMQLFVGSPAAFLPEGLPDLSDKQSLLEDILEVRRAYVALRLRLAGMSVGEGAFHDVISMFYPLNTNTALYHPNYNALFIVPAWLNSPAYVEGANSAYNYATLQIFAHEMTHGFDTDGTTYDKFGDPGTLWTSAADEQQFKSLAQRLADYHSTFEVAPDVMADGQHTVSEDIADLGGFEIAFQSYTDHLTSHGFHGNELRRQQRLFYQAYAHIWQARYTDAYAQERVTGDIHSLPRERVNALVPHTDAWYDLFDVKQGDKLYIAPENRVHIW